MAERIDNLTPLRGRPSVYPWPLWTDGQARRLVKGTDFSTDAFTMRSVITAHASRNGLRVQTRVPDDATVEFQFLVEDVAA
jgi:hypothetical protein